MPKRPHNIKQNTRLSLSLKHTHSKAHRIHIALPFGDRKDTMSCISHSQTMILISVSTANVLLLLFCQPWGRGQKECSRRDAAQHLVTGALEGKIPICSIGCFLLLSMTSGCDYTQMNPCSWPGPCPRSLWNSGSQGFLLRCQLVLYRESI